MQALRDAWIKKLLPKVTILKNQLVHQLPELAPDLGFGGTGPDPRPARASGVTTAKWHRRPGLSLLHDNWCLKNQPRVGPGEAPPCRPELDGGGGPGPGGGGAEGPRRLRSPGEGERLPPPRPREPAGVGNRARS